MPKRAAIITAFDPFLFKGGIETYTLQLISLLESRHIEVTVYHTGLLSNENFSVRKNCIILLSQIHSMALVISHQEKKPLISIIPHMQDTYQSIVKVIEITLISSFSIYVLRWQNMYQDMGEKKLR